MTNATQKTLLETALSYAACGWHVIPLHKPLPGGRCTCLDPECSENGKKGNSRGKHPRITRWQDNSSRDPEQVGAWWDQWPTANIGVVCGASGLLVVDVDGPEGERSLSELEAELGALPATVEVISGQGRHLYYKHPGGHIKNQAGLWGKAKIDLRADGGYVVAPPSAHYLGHRYAWREGHGPEDIAVAELPEDWMIKLTRQIEDEHTPSPIEPTTTGDTRCIMLRGRAAALKANGASEAEILSTLAGINARECNPPLDIPTVADIAAKAFAAQPGSQYFAGRTFVPVRVAADLASAYHIIYVSGLGLQVYDPALGIYREQDPELDLAIARLLGERLVPDRLSSVREVLRIGRTVGPDELNCESEYYITVANGRLFWPGDTLYAHSPEALSTIHIPVEYDPQATCPQIDKFFAEVLPADCQDLVDELFGYCLLPDTTRQEAFMLVGSGANGKSVFCDLLTAFLGPENVAGIPLQELDGNRFKRAGLYGKLANIFSDLDARALTSSSYFKTVASGDVIDAERKFGDPFTFRPFARMVYSANETPRSTGRSHGYYRRWIIIPFERVFAPHEQDKGLFAKLTTPRELSGLLNRALSGLHRLMDNDNGCFSEPAAVRAAMAEYQSQNDSVVAWVAECVEVGDTGMNPASSYLYQSYTKWCNGSGMRAVSSTRFSDRLSVALGGLRPVRRNTGMVWPGIVVAADDDTPGWPRV